MIFSGRIGDSVQIAGHNSQGNGVMPVTPSGPLDVSGADCQYG